MFSEVVKAPVQIKDEKMAITKLEEIRKFSIPHRHAKNFNPVIICYKSYT